MGAVDILVNNAGASWGAPAEDHPVEAWDKVMNLNVRGIFLLTSSRQAQHDPEEARAGSSTSPRSPAWAATRRHEDHRLQHVQGRGDRFTQTLAAEWGKYGINVNAICPGFFPTKMAEGLIERSAKTRWPPTRRSRASATTRT